MFGEGSRARGLDFDHVLAFLQLFHDTRGMRTPEIELPKLDCNLMQRDEKDGETAAK
jgi:hypothetical protein